MLPVFKTMAQSVLTLLGEDAFFDGATTTSKINIEHGVQLTGIGGEEAQYRGDLVAERDVATILSSLNPKAGKQFTMAAPGGKTYQLDQLLEDNGVTKAFVIMEVTWATAAPGAGNGTNQGN